MMTEDLSCLVLLVFVYLLVFDRFVERWQQRRADRRHVERIAEPRHSAVEVRRNGWSISADGSAEFSDTEVRGTGQ